MLRLSALLATVGAALLAASFMPWSAPAVSTSPDPDELLARQLDQGRVLFRDKGCATCHTHVQVPAAGGECCRDFGPDLSTYRGEPAFLQEWLAAPAAVRPQTMMPDLGLSEAEIADLIAFLNQP
jgi:cytochrome c2